MNRSFARGSGRGLLLLATWCAMGCGKGEAAATGAKSEMTSPLASGAAASAPLSPPAPTVAASPPATGPTPAPAAPSGDCKHAACADNFFVDTAAPDDCASGAPCKVAVKLVALGEFHVNDEYPYRFKADEAPDVAFAGTDALGKGVFSKSAGDWHKADAKTGAMTVKFIPQSKGPKTISGTFKLSVCSAENCLLEQRQVSVPVVAH